MARLPFFYDIGTQLEGVKAWNTYQYGKYTYVTLRADDSRTIVINPRYLKAGSTYTIYLTLRATSAGAPLASVDIDSTQATVPSETMTPLKHAGPVTVGGRVQITGVDRASFLLEGCYTELTDDTPELTPGTAIAVEAYLPLSGQDIMRLDSGRLDMTVLERAELPPTVFRLDTSRLNGGYRLYAPQSSAEWSSILGPSTSIHTNRGVTAEGPALMSDPGIMTIESLDGLDPRALGITVGTPVRLFHVSTATPIFTGQVSNVRLVPEPATSRHTYRAQITVADRTAEIAAYTRYGARSATPSGSESWTARAERYTRSLPHLPWTIMTGSALDLPPTVWETSLANHLDALVASTAGAWYVNAYGVPVIYSKRLSDAPRAHLAHRPIDGPAIYYSEAADSWTAGDVVARVSATTHPAAKGDDGAWQAADQTIEIADPTTVATWAGRTLTVDLLTYAGRDTEHAARRLLQLASANPEIDSVTIPVMGAGVTNPPDLATLCGIDILSTVTLDGRSETTTPLVSRIEHEITPETWNTRLHFTRKDANHG